MEVRTESFLGNDKVIVGNKYTDLVLETLGKVYIKTGNSSRVLSDVLKLLDKSSESDIGSRTIIVHSTLEMEEMEYPGDGFFVYNTLNTTLYLSYDNHYVALIEAAEGADDGYVRRKGDTMTGQLEINTVAAPLVVASSKLVRNLNAEYLGGYSYEDLAKKKVDEVITGNWTFKGKGTSENNWVFKQNVRMYGDLVASNSLTSPEFASGFSGYGWRLDADTNTLTVDYLVVRKAMRVYEMVINKISATNGSLWVSNSCKCEAAVQPIILTSSQLGSFGVWTGSQENKDAMLRILNSGSYYLPQVSSNIESQVTLTKELSKPSTINTTAKTFINYKFIIHIKNAEAVVNSPLFKGPQSLYDESILAKEYSQYTGSVSEDEYKKYKGAISLYYISKERVVSKWSPDNDPLEYTYSDSINKDISFVMIPKNASAMDDYEANGLNSKSLVEIKTFYKYFALDNSLMNTAIGQANEQINSGNKPVIPVPNLWVVDTDPDEYPTLKAGDIIRCQKYTDGNIKYYDALVVNQIESRRYIMMKATSVFDIYTELHYGDDGTLISSKEEYNNTQYNKTEQSYSSATGTIESSSKSSTPESRLDDIAAKDDMIQMGNIQDVSRQNAIYLTSCDDQGPYIDIVSGLDKPDYSVLYDIPVYDMKKAFIKKKGTIYSKGDAADYYYQTVNPKYINSHEKPSHITSNTKEYPLVFVKVTKTEDEKQEDLYEVLINDGTTTEITSTILANPSKYGFFITDRPTIHSAVAKGTNGKYRHAYTKSTKVRLGNLEGINNEVFGTKQPYGFGLYGENVFLTGEFYLSTGQSVVDFNKDYAEFLFGDLNDKYTQLVIDIDGISATVDDNKGNIAHLSMRVDQFEMTVSKLGYIDPDGNWVPTETSGFVTKSNLSVMFSAILNEDGTVANAASIMTAINNDVSEVTISADKINFEGSAIFTSKVQGVIGQTTINGNMIATGSISADKIDTTNLVVRNGAFIGQFKIVQDRLEYSKITSYLGSTYTNSVKIGRADDWSSWARNALVDIQNNFVTSNAFMGLRVQGWGTGIYTTCYSTDLEENITYPNLEKYRFALYADGPVFLNTGAHLGHEITTESSHTVTGKTVITPSDDAVDYDGVSITKPNYPEKGRRYMGVTFGKGVDLDKVRIVVVNGLIVNVIEE